MNRRDFIKSSGVITLVPTKVFAQEKKQSTINGIPVKITKVNISYISSPYMKSFGDGFYPFETSEVMSVELEVNGRIYHNIYDRVSVIHYIDGVKFVEFVGVVSGINVKANTTSLFLKECVKEITLERCKVV